MHCDINLCFVCLAHCFQELNLNYPRSRTNMRFARTLADDDEKNDELELEELRQEKQRLEEEEQRRKEEEFKLKKQKEENEVANAAEYKKTVEQEQIKMKLELEKLKKQKEKLIANEMKQAELELSSVMSGVSLIIKPIVGIWQIYSLQPLTLFVFFLPCRFSRLF